ncbi:MAG: ABC transporter permease [Vicinamibacterales bacterium]
MPPEPSRWIRWLFRVARFRASEAQLGDMQEELASGDRNALWLVRQILSTIRKPQSPVSFYERRTEMLSNFWSDIRYTLRTFRRNPGFAVAAVVPIAFGIGINTGVFSILNNVAFRPLPAPNPTELVSVYQEFQGVQKRRVHGARMMFSTPEYRVYRDATRTLAGVAAYSMPWTFTLGGQSPQELEGVLVTCNYFDVLQLRPAIGTGFTGANCDTPSAPPAVVLSHALWTRSFAADPEIVRQTIMLNGQSVVVVGVGPEGFDGVDLTKAAFFASTSLQRGYQEDPQLSWLTLLGRRERGADLSQVRAELAVIAGRIDRQQPGRTTVLNVAPATSLTFPVARREFFSLAAVVMAAFGLVLLIACANVGNVLLARAAGRTKEIAVRLSLGASRGRLILQLLTESLTIALAGGIAGSLFAWWSFQMLLARLPSSLPGDIPQPRIDARPDLTVLLFGMGLTVVTALVCGMVPAIQASKPDLHTAMKQGGVDSGGRTAGWLRGTLIAVQIAVCMVLLISAGLLLRALYAAHTIDPGFEYRDVAVVSYAFRGPGYDDVRVAAFQREFLERISALPGVDAVAQVSKIPLSPGRHQTAFRLPHREDEFVVDANTVSAEYFSLLRIPIVRGRTFTAAELQGEPRAVIVSEATARRYWPGQDPVGRDIVMDLGRAAPLEIVGVARDAHVSHVAETESSYMYLPAGPSAQRGLRLLVRSQTDFAPLARSISAPARELDSALAVRVDRLERNMEYWRGRSRLTASLSGVLSVLALLLALVGVYGVVSYVVNRRRRELGIRMTLGATARDVQYLIVRQTLRPVVMGLVIGLAAAGAASRAFESVLFGISPLDPIAFIGATLFLSSVAVVATLLPTREALKVDPVSALRYE